jgi:hypothetical protein
MTEPTNQDRADRVTTTLAAYMATKGETPDTPETDLIDLLADIRHFCDTEELALGDLDRIAHGHYLAEVQS